MSESTYTKRIKKDFHSSGWTVINLESIGEGTPDFLIAKNKKCFLIEAKFKNRIRETDQIVWDIQNGKNIDISVLRKDKEGLKLTTDKNNYLFKSVKELIDFFERRIV